MYSTLAKYFHLNLISHFQKAIVLLVLLCAFALHCLALEPEPRQWNHLPINTSFGGGGYAYTKADILLNPALLLTDVEMEIHTVVGKYIRTFELFNRTARIDISQAFQEGKWTGLVDGKFDSISRSGAGDTRMRVSANIYGTPPLSGREFAEYRAKIKRETVVGVALAMRMPTGDYMKDKLINLGKNRFTFRPQLGVMHTRGKWTADLTSEVAFFTDNDEFYNGNRLEQEPLYIMHAHLVRNFSPGLWTVASVGFDYGGETSINGEDKDDTNHNIGWGLSLGCPLSRKAGIKLAYIGTRTQKSTGLNSDTIAASFSLVF